MTVVLTQDLINQWESIADIPKGPTLDFFKGVDGLLTLYLTAADLTAQNPVLTAGQRGVESDTGKAKTGDGVTAWTGLPYEVTGGEVTGGLDSFVQTDVEITAAGVIPRSARLISSASDIAKVTGVDLDLASAGRVDLPIAALVGERFSLFRVPDSAVPTVDIEGDTDNTTGIFSVTKPLQIPNGGRLVVRLVSIDPGTGLRYWEIESGSVIGQEQHLYGPLKGQPNGTVRPTLSGFNGLSEISRSVATNTAVAWGDLGKIIEVTAAATITIPANAASAFPIGSVVAVLASTASAVTLAITTDTLTPQQGSTLVAAGNGAMIGAIKLGTTRWQALGRFGAA